jgi:LPS-assembly protein
MNNEPPVFLTEYRHRFKNAHINFDGSVGYSERTESDAGVDVEKDEEIRGHVFSEGWRAGYDIAFTTDDQYLRQFDISNEDILENELYFERFSGRNYSSIRALAFQDTRIRNESRDFDQPNILPEITTVFLGEPNQLLGGRWSLELSALGLNRKDDEQDMERLSSEIGWEKRFLSDIGVILTSNISAVADFYHVNDKTSAAPGSGKSTSGSTTRTFVQSHNVLSYPFINTFEESHLLIEPKIGLTLAPNIDVSDTDIPNEDSQDVQLDTSNLFEANRFPGRDRLEDQSRVTFGISTGLYDYNGSKLDFFIGQSYRLDEDDNPFTDGSGLDEQSSDVVGQLSMIYENVNLNYRFQLDDHNLSSQRHELDSYLEIGSLQLSNSYLFAKALEGTSTDESREQLSSSAQFRLNRNWRLTGTSRYDLGDDPGLRKASVGINYVGCCLGFGIKAQRNLTSDASGDSSTDITFRIGLKNIGEFSSGGDSFGMYSAGYE